jgi:hypothetical protein
LASVFRIDSSFYRTPRVFMVKNWFKQSEITIFEKIYGGNAEECLDSPDEIP